MKQSTTIPATLWVLLYASTSLLLVAHCTEFDGDFRPEQQGDDELKRSFLDLLGLKSPPLVNRTRAVRVPEYLEGVYKNDGTNTFTRQGDREARAIRATRVNRQSRRIYVTYELSDVQASILDHSDVVELLLRWDVNRNTSHHLKLDASVAVCSQTGPCSRMVVARRHRFTGERERADVLDITKAVRESFATGQMANLRLRLKVKSRVRDEHDLKPDDCFLVLFRSIPTRHQEFGDFPAQQPIRSERVRRALSLASIIREQPSGSVAPGSVAAGNGAQEIGAGCELLRWYISFEEVGWGDWIITPRGFTANHCSGRCQVTRNLSFNCTNHAFIKNVYLRRVHRLGQPLNPAILPVTCVPRDFNSMSLIYMNDESELVNRIMVDMVVRSCSCM